MEYILLSQMMRPFLTLIILYKFVLFFCFKGSKISYVESFGSLLERQGIPYSGKSSEKDIACLYSSPPLALGQGFMFFRNISCLNPGKSEQIIDDCPYALGQYLVLMWLQLLNKASPFDLEMGHCL